MEPSYHDQPFNNGMLATVCSVLRTTVLTRYLPQNPGSPLFMRDLGG